MKKTRFFALLLSLCMLLSLLAGCKNSADTEEASTAAATNAAENKSNATRTITDLEGREVTIPENVESVIAIPWPWTSIVYAVDGTADHIASMSATAKKSYENCMFKTLTPSLADTDSGYIDDAAAGGAFGAVNFEEMAKIDPDLVIVYKAQSNDIPNYEAIDVPVVIVNYGNLEEVQKGIRLLGEIFHKEDRAEQIISYHKEAQERVKPLVKDIPDSEKPSVLYLYNSSLMTQPIGFPAMMIEQAGGINAAKDLTVAPDATNNFTTMDMETIYNMDPDVILLSNFDPFTPEDIYNNKVAGADWSQLKAVKNHRVYKIPMGIYRWSQPNVEAHLFLEWLGKVLQPEAFADVSLKFDTADFYSKMFDHQLTDEELNQMFRTKANGTLKVW